MFTWLENKKLMLNTSLASAVRMKSLFYFYFFKQQMPFIKELKQKAKLARACPKCTPGASKSKNNFGGGPLYPQGGWPHLTATPTWQCVPRWGPRPPLFGPCHNNNCPGYLSKLSLRLYITSFGVSGVPSQFLWLLSRRCEAT